MTDPLHTRATQAPARRDGSAGSYLLVIEDESSRLVALPSPGAVVIGRAPECDVQLADVSASRRHSGLAIAEGVVTLRDLGSQNGTLVNGEPVELDHLPARLLAATAPSRGKAAPSDGDDDPAGAPAAAAAPGPGAPRPLAEELRDLERRRIAEAYAATGYVQTPAAERIGMPLRTFIVKLKQYGIVAPAK